MDQYKSITEIREHISRIDILLDLLQTTATYENVKDLSDIETTCRDLKTKVIKQVIFYKNKAGLEKTKINVKPAPKIEIVLDEVNVDDIPELTTETKQHKVYHPDPKLNEKVKLWLQTSGGVPLDKIIGKFSLPKPEIELHEVLQFLSDIREKRHASKLYGETSVYIHLCEYSTFYVGLSKINYMGNGTKTHYESVLARLHDHRNWHDSPVRANWTALYKVLTNISYIPGDKKDENLITELLVKCVGCDNVRGGDYTYIGTILPSSFTKSLEDIKHELLIRSE
jgi:hypothetical protein